VSHEFVGFSKIPRLSRECFVTEKIDGTNASVLIAPILNYGPDDEPPSTVGLCTWSEKSQCMYELLAGSRTRWIQPENDNHGFAKWAYANAAELVEGLGEGRHFGEWWGGSIQRGYGLKEKRFSLFNTGRWRDQHLTNDHWYIVDPVDVDDDKGRGEFQVVLELPKEVAPFCCYVVPILAAGMFTSSLVELALATLREGGGRAAFGFAKPEGVVVYHTAGRVMFKKTLEGDEIPKGIQ
jgi:hypothetical protein